MVLDCFFYFKVKESLGKRMDLVFLIVGIKGIGGNRIYVKLVYFLYI